MNALSARRTLVTGASRPLGIEFVHQALLRGDTVYAAARNPARVPVLADLRARFSGLELLALDPADPASVADAVPVLESLTDSLDLLVLAPAEAGAHERQVDQEREDHLSSLTGTGVTEHYRRHAVAPLLLVRTLMPWLVRAEGARVLMVSTTRGSLTGKTSGMHYATSASAAGLHMLTRTLAHDLADERITVLLGNPGEHAEGPDGADPLIPLDDVAGGLLTQVDRLPRDRSGSFLDWTGAERAW